MACVFPCIFSRVSTRSEGVLLFRATVVEECGAIPDIEDKEGEVRLGATERVLLFLEWGRVPDAPWVFWV